MTPVKSSAGAAPSLRPMLRVARQVLYWGLPPLLLYFIFRRINLEQLGQLALNADLYLVLAGICMLFPVVVLGALRWHMLVRRYDCASFPFSTLFREYWQSLAVGVLVPGSLGSDAYRVVLAGRQKGRYLRSAFVIGVEKIAALFSCAALIAGLYPLLAPNHLPPEVAQLVDALYLIFLAGGVGAVSLFFLHRQDWIRCLAMAFNARIEALVRRVVPFSGKPPVEDVGSGDASRNSLSLLLTMVSPAVAFPVVALSLAIYLVSATQSQVFFQAFGYAIPLSVNLFITPFLFLLYALPISFGGIGVREGAFILAYSAFDVPPETALIISFSGLLGNLISYAIGAVLFFVSRNRQRAG